jgi:hypothetical protein
MKVYVAARAKHRAQDVAQIHKQLNLMGYELSYDWPQIKDEILKPYRETQNRKHNLIAQEKMLKDAAGADIFILLDDPGLRGAYVELGAFLTDCLDNPVNRRAYIVGPQSHEREFIFESPEYVIFADTIEEVYKDLENDTKTTP